MQADQIAVSAAALEDGRVAIVSPRSILVTHPFRGCAEPVDDLGDVACADLTGQHASGDLPARQTLWWACNGPAPELILEGGAGTVCVDGAPAHARLPEGLRARTPPTRLHPLQSFASPVTLTYRAAREGDVLLHDPLDGSGWQRLPIDGAQLNRSGVLLLAEEMP